MGLGSAAKLIKFAPRLSKAARRAFTASSHGAGRALRSLRGPAKKSTSAAIKGLDEAAKAGTDAVQKGFLRARHLGAGALGIGAAVGVNALSPTFIGKGEDETLLQQFIDLFGDETPETREALRLAELTTALETDIATKSRTRQQLEGLARGQIAGAREGLDFANMSPTALRLLGHRDAATRQFGTPQETLGILGAFLEPDGSAIQGITPGGVAALGRDIPLLRLMNRGERARLAEASRSSNVPITEPGGVKQALSDATALGAQG